jgi:hypothetical protein
MKKGVLCQHFRSKCCIVGEYSRITVGGNRHLLCRFVSDEATAPLPYLRYETKEEKVSKYPSSLIHYPDFEASPVLSMNLWIASKYSRRPTNIISLCVAEGMIMSCFFSDPREVYTCFPSTRGISVSLSP